MPSVVRFPTFYYSEGATQAKGCKNGGETRRSPKRQQIVELLNVGGNANNGAQCGLSYANSNNAFSNSNTNIGARLNINT